MLDQMTGGKHLQQRVLKARLIRAPVRKAQSQAPLHYPSPEIPSNSQASPTWVSPAPRHQPLQHMLSASIHHNSYSATALDLPNLLEASLLEQQNDAQPSPSSSSTTPNPHTIPAAALATELSIVSTAVEESLAPQQVSSNSSSLGLEIYEIEAELEVSSASTVESGSAARNLQPPAHMAALLAIANDKSKLSLAGKPKTFPLAAQLPMAAHNPCLGRRPPPPPSPEHVATLSRVFRVTGGKAQALAASRPALLNFTEEHMMRRAKELAELLQTREAQALLAMRKQPFLLQVDMDTLRGRLAELQAELGLDLQLTCRLCSNAPSVLKRPADKLGARFERLAQSLAMTKAQVVDMSGRCSHTQFLTERSRKLQSRFEALAETLHLDADQTARVVRRQPDVLFMSSRILANKVKVLQAVFGTKHRQVTPLVAKCPEVLRRDMNSIRRIVCMLQVMLNVTPDFVYKMMAHNARLLSMNFQTTQWKAARLKQAATSCACWADQWQTLLPRHMEHCLAATLTTYQRLDYIMQTGQQENMKLLDALRVPLFKFEEAFPDYNLWLQQHQMRQQLAQ